MPDAGESSALCARARGGAPGRRNDRKEQVVGRVVGAARNDRELDRSLPVCSEHGIRQRDADERPPAQRILAGCRRASLRPGRAARRPASEGRSGAAMRMCSVAGRPIRAARRPGSSARSARPRPRSIPHSQSRTCRCQAATAATSARTGRRPTRRRRRRGLERGPAAPRPRGTGAPAANGKDESRKGAEQSRLWTIVRTSSSSPSSSGNPSLAARGSGEQDGDRGEEQPRKEQGGSGPATPYAGDQRGVVELHAEEAVEGAPRRAAAGRSAPELDRAVAFQSSSRGRWRIGRPRRSGCRDRAQK